MGCKTEEEGTAYETLNGGFTEVIGGIFTIGLGKEHPAIINNESNVSVFAGTSGMKTWQTWPIAVRETQNGITKELKREDLPPCFMESYTIPLYIGRTKKK
jgi:hypothetical protein